MSAKKITPIIRSFLNGKAVQYLKHREDEQRAKIEKEKLSGEIKEGAKTYGEADAKGTYRLELDNGIMICAIAKSKTVLNEDAAIALLKEKRLLSRCTKVVLVEEMIQALVQTGELTKADIDVMFTKEDPSYSVSVEQK